MHYEVSDVLVDYLVYMMYLMSVLEPPMILQLTGYNWIFHRIFIVKYYLKKINIAYSDSSTFCNENSETIQHVFVKCKNNTTFMKCTQCLLYEKCSKRVGVNIHNIIFGEYPLKVEKKALNCKLNTINNIYFSV